MPAHPFGLACAATLSLLFATSSARAFPGAGAPAPTFALYAVNTDVAMDLAGHSVISLEDLSGIRPTVPARAVLLAFFESSAPGAPGELQALARLQRKHAGALQVLALCTDRDLAEIGRVAKDLPYPVLRDRFRVVSDRYGASRGAVGYVLLDAEAQVLASWTGPVSEQETIISAKAGR